MDSPCELKLQKMGKIRKQKLFCTKCSLKFGSTLAKFNTKFAFNLHKSKIHEKNLKLITNTEKKAFKCQLCGYDFSSKQSMDLHVVLVHKEKKTCKCGLCEKCFSNKEKENQLLQFKKERNHSNAYLVTIAVLKRVPKPTCCCSP